MRVCLVGTGVHAIPPPGYGGVERTIAEYARALRAEGHEAVIVNEVRGERSLDEYRFALHLPHRLRQVDFDVLHASSPVVANRLAFLGEPFVYTTPSRHWFDRSGFRAHWGFWLERRAVRRADATVALTRRLRDQIERETGGSGPRRLVEIPIGVDTDRFRPAWDRRTGGRALGVGVVRPFKRWEVAARALRGTGFSLTIAGPTPDPGYAREVLAAGERVDLVGEVDEEKLSRLYAESDLLVHPSRVELLAGVVLQGLASGLPVLGAEPVQELIDDGVTGRATSSNEDAEVERVFHDSALAFSRDPTRLRVMGEAARGEAIARFGWPAVVDRHIALYRELPGSGGVSRRRGRAT